MPSRRRRALLAAVSTGLAGCTLPTTGVEPTPTPSPTAGLPEQCPHDGPLPEAGDWPTVRANARRTGANLDAAGPAFTECELWEAEPEHDTFDVAVPSVVDGHLYTGVAFDAVLDLETGTRACRGVVPDARRPVVVDDTFVVHDWPDDSTGRIRAVDPYDGTVRWSFATERPRSPTVASDTVTFTASSGGTLFGLDLAEGHERWRTTIAGPARSNPAATEEAVYPVSTEPVRIQSVTLDEGTLQWTATEELPEGDSILTGVEASVVADDHVYVAGRLDGADGEPTDSALLAVDATDGTLAWQFTSPAGGVTRPAVARDTLYFRTHGDRWDGTDVTPRRNGGLHALDAETGTERWFLEIDWDVAPVVGADAVYVADRAHVYAVEGEPEPPVSSYQVAGGSHRIREIALADGSLVISVVHEVHNYPRLAVLVK